MASIDFQALRSRLLADARGLLPQWLPFGKWRAHEFVCGGLDGSPGESLSINSKSGLWSDFASGETGGDLIDLYCAIKGIDTKQAAIDLGAERSAGIPAKKVTRKPEPEVILIPPAGTKDPDFTRSRAGKLVEVYEYLDGQGRVLGFIAKHQPEGESKQFIPWTWTGHAWVNKIWAAPRPLYGLDLLAASPEARVVLVEGEKCANAGSTLWPTTPVITWPGGAKAIGKIDWAPLAGRTVLLWPDNDAAGHEAMDRISDILMGLGCEVKRVDVSTQPEKWDLADAVADRWTANDVKVWLSTRVLEVLPPVEIEAETITPAPSPFLALQASIQERQDLWTACGLEMRGTGPVVNLDNICRLLQGVPEFQNMLWYDEFHEKIFGTLHGGAASEWSDHDDLTLTRILQSKAGMAKVTTTMVHDAVKSVARFRCRNEVKEWLGSLAWDGVHRLGDLMFRGFGAAASRYHQRVGECFLIGLIARAVRPGCKVDTMPVFEGGQGVGKSSALRILGGKWFTECHESIMSKDFFAVLKGNILVEISEMHAFGKNEVERIKGILTNQVDRYRAPYGRNAEDHPRQSVFAGTTNRDDWNRDETGARRFWPVACGAVDHVWLIANRDQLFAEAFFRFQKGEPWWNIPAEEAAIETDKRRPTDTWESYIEEFVEQDQEYTTQQLAAECLKIEVGKQDRMVANRISCVMRVLKWDSVVRKSLDRRSYRVWTRNP